MDAPSPQNEEWSEARISKGNHKEPTNSVGLPVFEEKNNYGSPSKTWPTATLSGFIWVTHRRTPMVLAWFSSFTGAVHLSKQTPMATWFQVYFQHNQKNQKQHLRQKLPSHWQPCCCLKQAAAEFQDPCDKRLLWKGEEHYTV